MRDLSYHRPTSLPELWPLLESARESACLLAGGTDVVPALKRGTLAPRAVIDVKRVPELSGIGVSPVGALRVGATTLLHQVARSPEVQAGWPVLAAAADTVASYQVRNRGTVGGNLCLDTRCSYFNQTAFWRAEYPDCRKSGGGSCYVVPRGGGCHALSSSDLAPVLVALGAQVEVASAGGTRTMPVDDLFAADGLHSTTLGSDEVLTGVIVPPLTGGAAYRRFATRETVDFPTASVAVALTSGGARLVVGHVTTRPVRVPQAEASVEAWMDGATGALDGLGESVVDGVAVTSSVRGSVSYKRQVLRALAVQVVVEAASKGAPEALETTAERGPDGRGRGQDGHR